jgi:haloalkane dehalogenase
MSYVDEGQGRPVVFLHGAPTWSYLFRHIIREQSRTHRCIAIDHLGFGLSDKPTFTDYSAEGHFNRFSALMDYLRLTDVTLVVHDAGGPIGLPWAMDRPERVRNLVLFNTWMWSLKDNRLCMRLAHLVGNPINRIYYRLLNASPTFIMPALFADRHRLPKPTQQQYLEPFRSFKAREGIYRMIEALEDSDDWFEKQWERRERLADKPALLLWGMKDPLYGESYLNRWLGLFHDYHSQRYYDTGRFVPDEAPRRVNDSIRWYLTEHSAAGVER